MGVRNYLIEGVSGAGKTTVAEELQRRGYHVIHGDRQFAYYGDPETGEPLDLPEIENEVDKIAWGYARWIWPVDKVRALMADQSSAMSFFCGGNRNSHYFIALFDAVFVLEIDLDTLNRRLARRPEDEFGGRPIERELIARVHATKEGLPEGAVRIDASGPVARVVDDILSRCKNTQGDSMATSNKAIFSLPGNQREIHPFGERQIVHATAEDTGGAMGIFEGFIAPGHGVHWHTHTREDEVFRVIEGQFRFWCGDQTAEGGSGTTVVGPRGIPHRWENIGDTEGRLLFIVTPGGFEKFFFEIAALSEISPEIVGAIEQRYGTSRNDDMPV